MIVAHETKQQALQRARSYRYEAIILNRLVAFNCFAGAIGLTIVAGLILAGMISIVAAATCNAVGLIILFWSARLHRKANKYISACRDICQQRGIQL